MYSQESPLIKRNGGSSYSQNRVNQSQNLPPSMRNAQSVNTSFVGAAGMASGGSGVNRSGMVLQ